LISNQTGATLVETGEIHGLTLNRLMQPPKAEEAVIGPFLLRHPLRQSGRLTLPIWVNRLHECLIPPISLEFTASQPNREKENLLRDWRPYSSGSWPNPTA
jgi:hypothetical protein